MPKTVTADSLTKDGKFFTNNVLEQMNGKTRKKNSRGRKTRSKKQGGAKIPYIGPYYKNPSGKLWDGVYENNYKMVEEAFKEGADVNMENDDGAWFLMVAAEGGNERMVNLFLEKGIDVNITDHYNNTALSTAVRNSRYDVVELLLKNDADINKENNDGDTPLMHAINSGDIDMVQLLLKHPDINIELELAEELEEDDQNQSGIPYLIKDYIVTKNQIKKQKDDVIKELSNYKRPNISSLQTMAYHQAPSALDTHINLNPDTIDRPYGKLGGKRKTRKKNSRGRKTRKKNSGGRKTPNAKRGRKLL